MNRFEERADRTRKTTLRTSMNVWTAALALVVVGLVILGITTSAPTDFWRKGAIVCAILLLVVRQVGRRLKGRAPKAIEPDPKSRLNLD